MRRSEKSPSSMIPLSAVIDDYIRARGLQAKRQEYDLRERWDEIVGNPISCHTRPDGIRYGTLYVLVDNSMWLQQLTYLKPDVMRMIHHHMGAGVVRDLVFRLA